MNGTPFLPYGRQCIEEDDIAAVATVLRGEYLTTGPTIEAFETALAKKVGARHAIVCSNGTTALYMAGRALNLQPGDSVIVPSVTFLATASAPHLCGAEIIFADVDPDTGLMRPEDLQNALHRAKGPVKALFNVHLTGQCDDLETIADVARASGLKIVDDACHAIGTQYTAHDGRNHSIGDQSFCDMTVFSFHPVKTITTGEGGAVVTNDDTLFRRLARARNHGMTRDPEEFVQPADALDASGLPNPWYYELTEPGFNFRATDFQCALGLSQLSKLDRFIKRRAEIAALYDRLLVPLAPKLKPLHGHAACQPARHLYVVLTDYAATGTDRAGFMMRLKQKGIGSQVHYFPVHRQPYFAKRYGPLSLPGADAYYTRALSLPFYPALSNDDISRVVEALDHSLN